MNVPLLFGAYLTWHYGKAPQDIVRIIGNYIWFFYNLFSIGLLLKTLFRPWKRLGEERKKGLDIESWFETLIVNSLMRVVGIGIRLMTIAVGIIFLATTLVGGAVVLVAWMFMPFLVAFCFLFGLGQLTQII